MSHFTKVATKIRDLSVLKTAIESLGYTYAEATEGQPLRVKGWENSAVEAEATIEVGCSYGIAVCATEDGYALNADWWAIETYTGKTETEILQEIEQKYAYETVMEKMSAAGYSVVSEEQADQSVRLVLRRWV